MNPSDYCEPSPQAPPLTSGLEPSDRAPLAAPTLQKTCRPSDVFKKPSAPVSRPAAAHSQVVRTPGARVFLNRGTGPHTAVPKFRDSCKGANPEEPVVSSEYISDYCNEIQESANPRREGCHKGGGACSMVLKSFVTVDKPRPYKTAKAEQNQIAQLNIELEKLGKPLLQLSPESARSIEERQAKKRQYEKKKKEAESTTAAKAEKASSTKRVRSTKATATATATATASSTSAISAPASVTAATAAAAAVPKKPRKKTRVQEACSPSSSSSSIASDSSNHSRSGAEYANDPAPLDALMMQYQEERSGLAGEDVRYVPGESLSQQPIAAAAATAGTTGSSYLFSPGTPSYPRPILFPRDFPPPSPAPSERDITLTPLDTQFLQATPRSTQELESGEIENELYMSVFRPPSDAEMQYVKDFVSSHAMDTAPEPSAKSKNLS